VAQKATEEIEKLLAKETSNTEVDFYISKGSLGRKYAMPKVFVYQTNLVLLEY
jgi:hypothetical protein